MLTTAKEPTPAILEPWAQQLRLPSAVATIALATTVARAAAASESAFLVDSGDEQFLNAEQVVSLVDYIKARTQDGHPHHITLTGYSNDLPTLGVADASNEELAAQRAKAALAALEQAFAGRTGQLTFTWRAQEDILTKPEIEALGGEAGVRQRVRELATRNSGSQISATDQKLLHRGVRIEIDPEDSSNGGWTHWWEQFSVIALTGLLAVGAAHLFKPFRRHVPSDFAYDFTSAPGLLNNSPDAAQSSANLNANTPSEWSGKLGAPKSISQFFSRMRLLTSGLKLSEKTIWWIEQYLRRETASDDAKIYFSRHQKYYFGDTNEQAIINSVWVRHPEYKTWKGTLPPSLGIEQSAQRLNYRLSGFSEKEIWHITRMALCSSAAQKIVDQAIAEESKQARLRAWQKLDPEDDIRNHPDSPILNDLRRRVIPDALSRRDFNSLQTRAQFLRALPDMTSELYRDLERQVMYTEGGGNFLFDTMVYYGLQHSFNSWAGYLPRLRMGIDTLESFIDRN
ncbi:MAG: hypothetical protein K1X83_06085 [Oligoflexia bacterium]|nr:hypothetical protein [Oligoflexia bacterium]